MHPTVFIPPQVLLSLLVLLGLTGFPAQGQEVNWRMDFSSACREAREKQRPLVIDFGTSNCSWCRKLDASTFRDPAIVKRLNEQFIPLKIDAEYNPGLAQQMQVDSYPTLVFISSEGRLLGRQDGFVEAARFNQQLNRALRESGLQTTVKQPMPSTPGSSIQPGSNMVVVRVTAPPASPLSTDLVTPEQTLLVMAQQDFTEGRHLSCLDRCTTLVATYPDSVEAREARVLFTRLKNDPLKGHQLTDQLGGFYLAQAEAALRANDPQRALTCLDQVLQVAPGTQKAELAQARRKQLVNLVENQPVAPRTIRAQSP